jgi:RNA polymerase sigma-70 factor, ECF subfamily
VNHHRLVAPARSLPVDEACLGAFQRELDYVSRTVRRLGTAPSEVEDLVQDIFLALRRSWAEYDPDRPLRPYLFGIAFRIASAHHRKRNREVAWGIVEVSDVAPRPDEIMQAKDARALVLAGLGRVPLARRAVLVMHDMDDVPVADVAAALSIPRFTAYSRLRKARREFEVAIRRILRTTRGG